MSQQLFERLRTATRFPCDQIYVAKAHSYLRNTISAVLVVLVKNRKIFAKHWNDRKVCCLFHFFNPPFPKQVICDNLSLITINGQEQNKEALLKTQQNTEK